MISFVMIESVTMLYSASGCQGWSGGVSTVSRHHESSLCPPLLDSNSASLLVRCWVDTLLLGQAQNNLHSVI